MIHANVKRCSGFKRTQKSNSAQNYITMRQIRIDIPSSVLKRVAGDIVSRYPESLQGRKNGKIYGSGYALLYTALLNHRNYLRRLDTAPRV